LNSLLIFVNSAEILVIKEVLSPSCMWRSLGATGPSACKREVQREIIHMIIAII
jgi:hypothetical protein